MSTQGPPPVPKVGIESPAIIFGIAFSSLVGYLLLGVSIFYLINNNSDRHKKLLLGFYGVPFFPILIVVSLISFIQRTRAEPDAQAEQQIQQEAGMIKHDTVTRTQILKYSPNFNSKSAREFDYTNPEKSFCTIVKYEGIADVLPEQRITEDMCCICLSSFSGSGSESDFEVGSVNIRNQQLIVLPCFHYFHLDCARHVKVRHLYLNPNSFTCLMCNLDLMRHYLYYKEHRCTPDTCKFINK